MRLNIFKIPADDLEPLKTRLGNARMTVVKEVSQDGWNGSFYLSTNPEPSEIPWAETFAPYFDDLDELPQNLTYYAVFLFAKDSDAFALSFGKSHFYIRPYSDFDFGVELAKRIANEADVRQTASKRFAGRRTKDIKSFSAESRLAVESGESVDYLQASIVDTDVPSFGKSGKFGTSAQLTLDIARGEIGKFLTVLRDRMSEEARFKLPRTIIISEVEEIERLDSLLLDELQAPLSTSEFAHNSYDLYGVDFVFSSAGHFELRLGRVRKELESLSVKDLKEFIAEHEVSRDRILDIKVVRHAEDQRPFTQKLKESIDFIPPNDDRVLLASGKWMRFNQDYLDFLDDYISGIEMEDTEPEFQRIVIAEPAFNDSVEVAEAGYEKADKNFDILRTRARTPIEAWDLRKGDTVYAVKFATAQKLGYVADQGLNVLHLLYNKAEVQEVPHFTRYCLWLGYRGKSCPERLEQTGSVILKQKVEAWARKAEELGITPVIKISHKVKAGVDGPEEEGGDE